MHKKVLLVFLVFLLVGCKRIEDNDNYIELVNNCLTKKSVTNEVALGYKYYLPKGMKKLYDYDYNQVFITQGEYVYLYVDIISYYYKKELNNNMLDSYYYNSINNGDKSGYIRIVQKNDKYLVNILYNYSKIEFYTDKSKINNLITLSSILLNSIDYNEVVIEKVLEGDLGKFSEFKYEVDKPDNAGSNFSQYLEEYVQKEEEKDKTETEQLPDE